MVVHNQREIAQISLNIYKRLLDDIFERAKTRGHQVTPEESMVELSQRLAPLVDSEDIEVSSRMKSQGIRLWRNAHKYAVSRYYRDFHGLGAGRPQTPPEEESDLLVLKARGLNVVQIAKRLGLTRDAVRKRLNAAKLRIIPPPKFPKA